MRTDQQIVDETNQLARYLLSNLIGSGYEVSDDHKFYEAEDPRSRRAWNGAVEIMQMLTKTDANDALSAIEPAKMPGLSRVIGFLEGFEGDELQEGIAELIATAKKADELLVDNLTAWEGEEDTVKDEHEDLIVDLRKFVEG